MRFFLLLFLTWPDSSSTFAKALNFSSLRNPQHDQSIHDIHTVKHLPSNKSFHPRDRRINAVPSAYHLDISVHPESGLIEGKNTISFKLKDPQNPTLSLDAGHMRIKAVHDKHRMPLGFDYDGKTLNIELPLHQTNEQQAVTIHYEALRSQSFFLTGPDASNPNRSNSSYTFTQPEGSQHWFPCIDRPNAKALLDIKIATPEAYKALSNGLLISEKSLAGITRYHYRMDFPVAPYLISLAVGEFEVHELGTYQNKPLKLWSPPAIAHAALKEVSNTAKIMEAIEEFTGVSYPFSSYSQAVAQAWSSSMEHQSATTMGGWRIRGDLSGEGVVAHELAHQWFGDWVTCESWKEMWLNEGFASYSLSYLG